jgi:outer membrane immunogenic protein
MRLRVLAAAGALGAVSTPALAADLGVAEPLPAPPVVAAQPANDWTGFYLGALAGWTWADFGTDAAAGDVDADGIDGGIYAGANWQWGNFVVGGEADFIISGVDGSEGALNVEQGLNGSLRARAGVALDRFLAYGTGGAALTEAELSNAAGSDSSTLWGWTVGAGVEALLTDNITSRVEYRYTDYEDDTFTLGGAPVNSDLTTHSLRAGVGYKF